MNEFENYPGLAERMESLANSAIPGWSMADWDAFCSAINNSLVQANAVGYNRGMSDAAKHMR